MEDRAQIPLTSSPTERTCAGAAPLPHEPDDRRAAADPKHDRQQRSRPHDHLFGARHRPGLAEVVGLDVGDVFASDGTPRVRVRVRAAIAKGGRAADVFLPDRLTRLVWLPLLAPVIQEEILAPQPVTSGRDAITERTLRAIIAEPVWERQVAARRALPGRRDDERGLCLRRKRAGEKDLSTALLSELDDVQ